jgi:hypothetical protein
MIQGHELNDPRDVARFPAIFRRAFVPPPFEAVIDCSGVRHAITVIDGVPLPSSHESDEERALHALGSEIPPCTRARERIDAHFDGQRLTGPTIPMPILLDRLDTLALLRTSTIRSSWLSPGEGVASLLRPMIGELVETRLRPIHKQHPGLYGAIRIGVGEAPALRKQEEPVPKTTVTVADSWLATAFLFDLMTHDGCLVAGVRIGSDQDVELSILRMGDEYRLERTRTRLEDVRFL